MYEFIQKAHSGFAYLALLLLVFAVVNAIFRLLTKKVYKAYDYRLGIYALGAIHTQVVLGVLVYFVSPLGLRGFSMSDSALRLTSLEHPLINIIGVVLMTIGWVKHKKLESSEAKFKTVALYFGIGLVLILSRLPWKMWF